MKSSRPEPRERLLSTPFVLLSAAHFLQGLALNLYVHFPGFLKGLQASELEIGGIFGLTAAVAIVVRPWMGRLMDERGRRVLIVGGGVLHVAVCLLYLTVHARGAWVALVRAVHGLAEAALFSGLFTFAADIVPASRRTEGIALFGVSGLLPIALSGLLGDLVLRYADYRALFLLSAAFAAIALLISLPLREVPRAPGAAPANFLNSLRAPHLLSLWFISIAFAICLAGVFVFLKLFLLTSGAGSVGQFLSVYIAAACVLRLGFGWLPDRIGATYALVPSLACLALGNFVLGGARHASALYVAGILCGLGHGFSFPILAGLVVGRARETERGTAIAIFTAIFDLGMLLGGPAFGLIAGRYGYGAMYTSSGLLCVSATLVYAAWERRLSSTRA